MPETLTVAALAKEARRHFTLHTRDDGTTYWAHDGSSDSGPVWIYDLAHDAHGDMFPDDYRYAFIVDALDLIVESDAEDADTARDIEVEADIYTHDLLKWLSSRNDRAAYCDEWKDENAITLKDFTLVQMISGGQYHERREVLESVISSLEKELEQR